MIYFRRPWPFILLPQHQSLWHQWSSLVNSSTSFLNSLHSCNILSTVKKERIKNENWDHKIPSGHQSSSNFISYKFFFRIHIHFPLVLLIILFISLCLSSRVYQCNWWKWNEMKKFNFLTFLESTFLLRSSCYNFFFFIASFFCWLICWVLRVYVAHLLFSVILISVKSKNSWLKSQKRSCRK